MLDFDLEEVRHRLAIKHELRRLGISYNKDAETKQLEALLCSAT